MASCRERMNYLYLTDGRETGDYLHRTDSADRDVEFDDLDIWDAAESVSSELGVQRRSPGTKTKTTKKKKAAAGVSNYYQKETTVAGGKPSSLPVNVPDWSKILREEYKENRRNTDFNDEGGEEDEGEEEEGEGEGEGKGRWLPPHEFLLARTRTSSFSVHEGIGRTLKGRDLSRVRNAIWAKIGFLD